MRRLSVPIALLALSVAAAGPATAGAKPTGASKSSFIVVYKDAVADPTAETDALERAHGFGSDLRYTSALKGFSARLSLRQVAELRADPNVAFVEADGVVHAVGTPTGVRRIEAVTDAGAHGPSTVNVAVIDTGIDLSHPDLNAVSGRNCVQSGAPAQDDHGHGTHVAGTIAAKDDGQGVVGVAPGTRLYAVKVLDSQGRGMISQVVCGIDWVTANTKKLNIKVANMSLAGSGFADGFCGSLIGDAMNRAICRSTKAGVTYVAAIGNSGAEFSTTVPAAYPEVLTATAISDSDGLGGALGGAPTCRTGELDDQYASFSNYATPGDSGGIRHIIAAPGVCIESTWLGGGTAVASGTSMATPHVTGSVALCITRGAPPAGCAGLTPAQVIAKVRDDAQSHTTAFPGYGFVGDPLHPVSGRYYGHLVWDGGY